MWMTEKTEVGQNYVSRWETDKDVKATVALVVNEYGKHVFTLTHEQALKLQEQLNETLANYNPRKTLADI